MSKTPAQQWSENSEYRLPKKLLEDFKKQVIALAEKTFGSPHAPLDIHIVDRTRFEPILYVPISYRRLAKTKDEMIARMNLILHNAHSSIGVVMRELNALDSNNLDLAEGAIAKLFPKGKKNAKRT